MNLSRHSEKKKTRQEAMNKIQQKISQLKLEENDEYVQ
jgi:hypothetical protein